ncbi:hypothetical protein DPMN_023912 [Dreissena polymorpha]|uniref:Uncharacterized protein n=1 Tax=Dreissena polymorpha TaxID=45954 RepID=A0A9D4RAB5_DREPO|nr:hypothetical protein DPMN_023912 [Dreissena polymorpha]
MEEENKITRPKRTQTMKQPKALKTIAMSVLRKPNYPKQALNIAYATYIWPKKLTNWKSNGKVANRIKVCGPQENDDVYFEPYYLPEFDSNMNDLRIYAYDKTHLGTNLRKALCLDKISGILVPASKPISGRRRPDIVFISGRYCKRCWAAIGLPIGI